jgi:hypothetical protein
MYYVFIDAQVIRHMSLSFARIFTSTFVPMYVAYEHHFFTEDVDDGCFILEYGVEVEFNQYSHDSHCNHDLIDGKLCYNENVTSLVLIPMNYNVIV